MKKFKTESQKVLDIMINSIYTNKDIFLRELVSNASDALDKLAYQSLTDGSGLDRSSLEVQISADKSARTLTIKDNGVGMSADELENNLGTIAKSGSEAFKKSVENASDVEIIGQFGVGFYSAFMVADKVQVLSQKQDGEAHLWTSCGAEGYEIAPAENCGRGTTVTLTLKADTDTLDRVFIWKSTHCAALLRSIPITYATPSNCRWKRKKMGKRAWNGKRSTA